MPRTAVNLECGKNLMGAFHQPVLAVCAPSCLETLPEAEMSCGWAKVIKYATLEGPVTEEVLADIISTCVEIKRDIVSKDEFEGGVRSSTSDTPSGTRSNP